MQKSIELFPHVVEQRYYYFKKVDKATDYANGARSYNNIQAVGIVSTATSIDYIECCNRVCQHHGSKRQIIHESKQRKGKGLEYLEKREMNIKVIAYFLYFYCFVYSAYHHWKFVFCHNRNYL